MMVAVVINTTSNLACIKAIRNGLAALKVANENAIMVENLWAHQCDL
jgi:hypothetical protein